jgi:hypothetical protein
MRNCAPTAANIFTVKMHAEQVRANIIDLLNLYIDPLEYKYDVLVQKSGYNAKVAISICTLEEEHSGYRYFTAFGEDVYATIRRAILEYAFYMPQNLLEGNTFNAVVAHIATAGCGVRPHMKQLLFLALPFLKQANRQTPPFAFPSSIDEREGLLEVAQERYAWIAQLLSTSNRDTDEWWNIRVKGEESSLHSACLLKLPRNWCLQISEEETIQSCMRDYRPQCRNIIFALLHHWIRPLVLEELLVRDLRIEILRHLLLVTLNIIL